MSASNVLSNAARSLADRAVHVKVWPRTRNIKEGREILRVLKEFGPVVLFRNLNQLRDTTRNTVLAVYDNPQSASDLVKSSPLTFNYHPPARRGVHAGSGVTGIGQSMAEDSTYVEQHIKAEGHVDMPNLNASKSNDSHLVREFHLTADVSLMDHQSYVERQPYYWGFALGSKTFPEEDLAKSVPLKGMSAISTSAPELPLRLVRKNNEEVNSRKTPRQTWEDAHQ